MPPPATVVTAADKLAAYRMVKPAVVEVAAEVVVAEVETEAGIEEQA